MLGGDQHLVKPEYTPEIGRVHKTLHVKSLQGTSQDVWWPSAGLAEPARRRCRLLALRGADQLLVLHLSGLTLPCLAVGKHIACQSVMAGIE